MGYGDGIAKKTGRIGEAEADEFLTEYGFDSYRPPGRDTGIDRIVTYRQCPNLKAKVQIKGRRQESNPRWFQLTVPPKQIKTAWGKSECLENLWRERIFLVDFWLLVSVPKKEVWVFPSEVIFEIANLNAEYLKKKGSNRLDNQYDKPHYTKNGKMAKKQKELNLNATDASGVFLWKRFERYKNNAEILISFFAEQH